MFLVNITGRNYLQGTNPNTNISWRQFELDYHNSPERGRCFICGKELEFGWENLSNVNQQVCDKEVDYEGKNPDFFPEEYTDTQLVEKSLREAVTNNWWL